MIKISIHIKQKHHVKQIDTKNKHKGTGRFIFKQIKLKLKPCLFFVIQKGHDNDKNAGNQEGNYQLRDINRQLESQNKLATLQSSALPVAVSARLGA